MAEIGPTCQAPDQLVRHLQFDWVICRIAVGKTPNLRWRLDPYPGSKAGWARGIWGHRSRETLRLRGPFRPLRHARDAGNNLTCHTGKHYRGRRARVGAQLARPFGITAQQVSGAKYARLLGLITSSRYLNMSMDRVIAMSAQRCHDGTAPRHRLARAGGPAHRTPAECGERAKPSSARFDEGSFGRQATTDRLTVTGIRGQ